MIGPNEHVPILARVSAGQKAMYICTERVRRGTASLAGQQVGQVAAVALCQHVLGVLLQLFPVLRAAWAAAGRLQPHHDGEQPSHGLARIEFVLLQHSSATSAGVALNGQMILRLASRVGRSAAL